MAEAGMCLKRLLDVVHETTITLGLFKWLKEHVQMVEALLLGLALQNKWALIMSCECNREMSMRNRCIKILGILSYSWKDKNAIYAYV